MVTAWLTLANSLATVVRSSAIISGAVPRSRSSASPHASPHPRALPRFHNGTWAPFKILGEELPPLTAADVEAWLAAEAFPTPFKAVVKPVGPHGYYANSVVVPSDADWFLEGTVPTAQIPPIYKQVMKPLWWLYKAHPKLVYNFVEGAGAFTLDGAQYTQGGGVRPLQLPLQRQRRVDASLEIPIVDQMARRLWHREGGRAVARVPDAKRPGVARQDLAEDAQAVRVVRWDVHRVVVGRMGAWLGEPGSQARAKPKARCRQPWPVR